MCSVSQLCLILCYPMDCSTSGFPVHHPPELAQIHVHGIGDAIQPSHPLVIPFSCLQSFPSSEFSLVTWLFTTGGQNIGDSAPVLPINIQDWLPLGLTGLIALHSKGLSRVFSNTTVQKHQFLGTQPSLWFNCPINTWLLGKP